MILYTKMYIQGSCFYLDTCTCS